MQALPKTKKQIVFLCLALILISTLHVGWAAAPSDGGPTAAQATPEAQSLMDQQRAAKQAALAAIEAPLPAVPAEEAGIQAAEHAPEGRLAKNIVVILLCVLIVIGVILIFRIPGAGSAPASPLADAGQPSYAAVRESSVTDNQSVIHKAEAGKLRIGNPRFWSLAVENNLISTQDGADLAERSRGNDFDALLQLVAERPHLKDALGKTWGDSIGFTYVNPEMTAIDPEAVSQIPREFAEINRIVPLYAFGGTLSLAAANPGDKALEELVINKFNVNPSFVFSFPEEIADTIAVAYQSSKTLQGIATELNAESKTSAAHPEQILSAQDLAQQANSNSIVEFVNGLILLAMNEMASDIHIEPDELSLRIRFRIDGTLQEKFILDKSVVLSLVSRLKLMAGCNIAERRLPQDGRIKFVLARRKVDIRFSAVPTLYGEKAVLRLLGSTFLRGIPNITDMDFSATISDAIKSVARAPNGVFFITGPTGSGKTTTLYSILKYINTPGINIMTVEDPVEYRLPGINQVQVNTSIDLDFANVLRAFLRQDPNVILIGEIRDIESARIASQAALTGHLVFATMHTNNALQAVNRMIDIGVEPFLVAPSLIALMAQRLVRRICSHCIEKYPAPKSVLDDNFEWDGVTEVFFSRGKGCARCHGTGFLGRIALHELFILNSATREKIAQNASILDVEEIALKSGFKPLRYDGLKKVLRGLTTIEEVDRVTYNDVE